MVEKLSEDMKNKKYFEAMKDFIELMTLVGQIPEVFT